MSRFTRTQMVEWLESIELGENDRTRDAEMLEAIVAELKPVQAKPTVSLAAASAALIQAASDLPGVAGPDATQVLLKVNGQVAPLSEVSIESAERWGFAVVLES